MFLASYLESVESVRQHFGPAFDRFEKSQPRSSPPNMCAEFGLVLISTAPIIVTRFGVVYATCEVFLRLSIFSRYCRRSSEFSTPPTSGFCGCFACCGCSNWRGTRRPSVCCFCVARGRQSIASLLFVLLFTVVVSGSLMFMLESEDQPAVFSSIPAAMWWAIETLTTVGYGDMVPVTVFGRIIGGAVSIVGIGTLALFSGLITVGFPRSIETPSRTTSEDGCRWYPAKRLR